MNTAAQIASVHRTNLFARGIGVLTIGLAILFFLGLTLAANRGLDYSDEAYSYFWARYPFEYGFALRLSGFFLHPVETFAQHSLAGFRLAGMFLTAASGMLVGYTATMGASRRLGWLERVEIVAACGIAMSLGNIFWMNTPSYQHMTVWGLAIFLSGFVILLTRAPASVAHQLAIASLIAAGGLILAFAKIPVAMAAAVLAAGLVGFAYEAILAARLRMFAFLVVVETLLLATVAMLVSPSRILDLFREGLALRDGYGGLQDILSKHMADLRHAPTRFIWTLSVAAVSMLFTLAATSRRPAFGKWPLAVGLVLGAIATCAALVYANPLRPIFNRYDAASHGLHMTLLAGAVLALAGAVYKYRGQEVRRQAGLLAMLIITAPWIASVGTGGNYLYQTSFYAGYSGLVIILANVEMPQLVARAARLLVVLMSGATLYFAGQHPYRLNGPIVAQNIPVVLDGLNGESLLVDGPTGKLFGNLRDAARAAGLSVGTPLFDLAGFGPGFNLVLGTKPPVYPWIAGGYPNSPAILDKIWSLTPAPERARAWVLGPIDKSFKGAVALGHLVPLDLNYELILKTIEPQSGMSIELWRPRNAAAAGK
jgi:hypothetical protein